LLLPVGAGWLALSRAGLDFGFGPLIAIGISISRPAEIVGVVTQSAGLMVLALLQIFCIAPRMAHRSARMLLSASGAALVASMLLALAYGLGAFTGVEVVSIPRMVALHGVLNAFGFAGCGLLGWTVNSPDGSMRT